MPARSNGSTRRCRGSIGNLRDGDLLLFTADHGNDPTWTGTDHTRERVPVVGWGAGRREIGQVGFADVGASSPPISACRPMAPGRSFL
jgi:phosphopentomutase